VQAQEEIQNKNCENIIEKFKICDVFELVTMLYLKRGKNWLFLCKFLTDNINKHILSGAASFDLT
jgi:hypothetical protein